MDAAGPALDIASARASASATDVPGDATGTPQEAPVRDVHLVLLLHGLYGSPANLYCLEEEIAAAGGVDVAPEAAAAVAALAAEEAEEGAADEDARTKPQPKPNAPSSTGSGRSGLEVVVLNAQSYVAARTWDGIDVNAQRVAEELDAEIARLESAGRRVPVISITGYSLGGLIARALVGQLHARTPSFFTRHRPAAFATIATPHLGVLRYGSWRSQWLHALGQRLFSRTGQQLYCLDNEHGGPLLGVMAHPERIYVRALSLFRSITVYANGVNDLTVPYCTAAICTHDPFVDHEMVTPEGRPHVHVQLDGHIVCSWALTDPDSEEVDALVCPSASEGEDGADVEVDVDVDVDVAVERVPEGESGGEGEPQRSLVARESAGERQERQERGSQRPNGMPGSTPLVAAAGLTGQRPWFPPPFYLNRQGILRYALFPLIPFLLPMVLSIVAITFAYHSFQSSQRLRMYQGAADWQPLLLGVNGVDEGSNGDGSGTPRRRAGYGATSTGSLLSRAVQLAAGSSAGADAGTGTADAEVDNPGTGASTPQLSPAPGVTSSNSLSGAGTATPSPSQPVLTPLQQSMVAQLGTLPLERVVAWFPSAFNAHAVIIARNARNPKWAWQAAGRQVVRAWAERVHSTAAELLAEPELPSPGRDDQGPAA